MSRFVAFLLKVWVSEALEDAARTQGHSGSPVQETWRGQIQHIRSGDVATFACHEEMLEFIRTHLAADPQRAEGEA